MTDIPETKYVRSGDADLAYQVFGSGADLVAIHGLPGHLEVMWELPEYAAFLDRLGTFGRVIMFDKRGTGMSDRLPGVPAVEQHMEDLIAVMDAAGSSRASVAGWADGAFMAAMLAATYPERVSALILCGLWLKALTGGRRPGLVADPDAVKTLSDRFEAGWRQGLAAPVLAPSYTDDEHFLAPGGGGWRDTRPPRPGPRRCCAGRFALTPPRSCPPSRLPPWCSNAPWRTTTRRRTGWPRPRSREPGTSSCRNANALPYLGDADAVLDEIEEFLTGARGPADFDRSLATVLFTDIVGSTEKAGDLGDRRWRYLLEDHHARVRRALDRFHGTEVDTAGDGFFATFDGPARAIRCACTIRDSLRDIGIPIRAGLHTGEVERRGKGATGLAVHVGARVAALAQASEVLVTSTVKMLVLGSGIGFADRGRHRLKGVPDQWQLFAVEHT